MASGTTTGLAVGATAGLYAAMRNAGLRTVDDLVTDALLNPDRAHILLSKVPAGGEASVINALARSYGNTAGRVLGAQEEPAASQPEPSRKTADLPDYMRRAMVPASAFPSSGNPMVDVLAAREMARPPWMSPEYSITPLQRALVEREVSR